MLLEEYFEVQIQRISDTPSQLLNDILLHFAIQQHFLFRNVSMQTPYLVNSLQVVFNLIKNIFNSVVQLHTSSLSIACGSSYIITYPDIVSYFFTWAWSFTKMLNVGAAEIYKSMQLCLYKYSSLYLEMIRRVFAATTLCNNHMRNFVVHNQQQ